MPRYLVTGGLGFIGSHLTSKLLSDPHAEVVVVDCLINTVWSVDEIVEQISADRSARLEVLKCPIEQFEPTERFDVIYHLASVVGPAAVLNYAGRIAQRIIADTYRVIEWAQLANARLINVSTSEIFGGSDGGFCRESTDRIFRGPASARQEYAAGKMTMEIAIENLVLAGDLNAVAVRPFNVAGVRQIGRAGFVLPRFVGQALMELPLTVFGDGSQVRAFTDVRDVVDALILVSSAGKPGESYNLGNPANKVAINELADSVLAITGSSAGKTYVDPKAVHGPHYREAPDKFPDARKLFELGWKPNVSLERTILDTYDWMRRLPESMMKQVAGLESSALDAQLISSLAAESRVAG